MTSRNKLLSNVLSAYGGNPSNSDSMTDTLNKIIAKIGGPEYKLNIRNSAFLEILSKVGAPNGEKTRNSLMSSIVSANGGAVRNPNVRNMIIEDWVSSISNSRSYFLFDGIDDVIITDDPETLNGDVIKLSIIPSLAPEGSIISRSTGNYQTVLRVEGGVFLTSECSATIDGVSIISGETLCPSDNLIHHIVATKSKASMTNMFGAQSAQYSSSGTDRHWNGVIFDIDINDGSSFYPMDDGWASYPVIKNTGAGTNATLLNGQELGWVSNV